MAKRVIALLLVAALAACAAAEGNLLMEMKEGGGVSQMLSDGDALYIVGGSSLYTWRPGETALRAWEDAVELPGPEDGDEGASWRSAYDGARFFVGERGLCGARLVRGANDELQALQLCDIALAGGELRAENVQSLSASAALRDAGLDCILDLYLLDGALYMLAGSDGGMVICVADSAGERHVSAETAGMFDDCRLLAMSDGVLLARHDLESDRVALERLARDGSRATLCELSKPCDICSLATDGQSVCAVWEGRICPVDLTSGEIGAPASAVPLPPDCAALADGGRAYAAAVKGRVAVLDITGRLAEDGVLTVRGASWVNQLSDTILRFSVEHPELTPVLVRDDAEARALDDALTRSTETDVYILGDEYSSPFEALVERGYALPLDGSDSISGLISRMYPGAQSRLCHDGVAAALPLRVGGSGLGVGLRALEALGLSASDLPEEWAELPDFLERQIKPRLGQLPGGCRFTYDDMEESVFRHELQYALLNDWVWACEAAGIVPDYGDPRLVGLMERLEAMDLSGCGLEQDRPNEEAGVGFFGGYSWGSGGDYLICLRTDYAFSGDDDQQLELPLRLGFGDDLPAALPLRLEAAAIVNPNSAHPEAAVALLEALADDLSETLLYALCPDLTEPARRENEAEVLAYYEKTIAWASEQLEAAAQKDRQEWEVTLRILQDECEEYREHGVWLIPAERLEWYRGHDERLILAGPTWFERDGTGEARALRAQYEAGQLTAREFLEAVNRKARMQALEGN